MELEPIQVFQRNDGRGDEWVTQVYVPSFPESERFEPDVIREQLASGVRQLHLSTAYHGQVVLSLSILRLFNEFVWLSWFAVNPLYRKRGLGHRHGEAMIEYAKSEFPKARGFFWMVDAVVPGIGTELHTIRERRIAFYQRLGAQRTPPDVHLWMPNFALGTPSSNPSPDELLPIEMMWVDIDRSVTNDDKRHVINCVYRQTYKLSDEFTAKMAGQFA